MRRIRYQEIADELRRRTREAAPGSVLPSEADLSTEFGASRVTVRRALEIVRDDGLIAARQGFGWYVATEPVPQHLEHLGTIESQLEVSGRVSERRVLEFAFVSSPARVRAVLNTDRVLRVKRVNLGNGEPFAVVTVWCPAALGKTLSMGDVERQPFYELLPVRLRGATQTIGAASADAATAELLSIPIGAPILKCLRITTDTEGNPVLMSEFEFSAHRTEFVVELPNDQPSSTPAGLRLVHHG